MSIEQYIIIEIAPIKCFDGFCDKCGKEIVIKDGLGKSLKHLLQMRKWNKKKNKIYCFECSKDG